jgi:hypothetical protein
LEAEKELSPDRKDVGFNLIGCVPDVLLVLSICGWSEQQNSTGETWSSYQSQGQKSGSWESKDRGTEVRDFGMLEKRLEQE